MCKKTLYFANLILYHAQLYQLGGLLVIRIHLHTPYNCFLSHYYIEDNNNSHNLRHSLSNAFDKPMVANIQDIDIVWLLLTP